MPPQKTRPWFQLHFSTFCVLMVLAAVLWGLYVNVFSEVFERSFELQNLYQSGQFSIVYFLRNYPLPAAILIGCSILMFVGVACVCERSIRRMERGKSGRSN